MTQKTIVIAYKDGQQYKEVFPCPEVGWAVYYRLKREGWADIELIPYGQWVCLCVITICAIGILVALVTSYLLWYSTCHFEHAISG